MQKFYCDNCGGDIKEGTLSGTLNFWAYNLSKRLTTPELRRIDLCSDCVDRARKGLIMTKDDGK